jgi:hypothetical protein
MFLGRTNQELPGALSPAIGRASWNLGHLARIRQDPATFAPGGVRHLILEVVAYAAEERPEWLCHDLKVRRPSPVPAHRQ